jgi:hypothetical protein
VPGGWCAPRLVDVLLQREALVALRHTGRAPHDFAGLFVGDDDARRALGSLPGLSSVADASDAPRESVAAEVASARQEFRSWLGTGGRFGDVVRSTWLTDDEAEVFALLTAVELSPARQRLVCYLQDNIQLPRLTVDGLGQLFAGDAGHVGAEAVAPGAALQRAAFVNVAGDGPLAVRPCVVADRVLWHFLGDDTPDQALPLGVGRRRGGNPRQPGSRALLLLVHGGDPETRRRVAYPLLGDDYLVSPAPVAAEAWAALVREAGVLDVPVLVELETLDTQGASVIERAVHVSWVLSSPRELPVECLPARAWSELRADDADADADDWERVLGREPDPGHRLTREQLRLVATIPSASGGAVGPAVRRLAGGHLDGLAVRVRPRRGWTDLVLGDEESAQLHELVHRHRRRTRIYRDWGFPSVPSSGVVALFSGPSGTGKTLAAEVVAGELGLDLYKVDLSAVVSKYIGETEKNLERIFTAAAAVDLVLFFDEADALFGRRSEVSDAHDRYANIEVAYLLQRLEAYDGVVIMATNLQRNVDPAFLRRISVAVDFTAPDAEQRRGIWECSFPDTAPVGELDLGFLSERFKVTGGVIHGAALGAAFLAAEADTPITTLHVVRAMRREFGKLGRLCTEAEFGPYLPLVNGGVDAPAAR